MQKQSLYLFNFLLACIFLIIPFFANAAPGELDPTFGSGGKVIFSDFTKGFIAIQANGKIVSVASNDTYNTSLFRLNSDGTIDKSFGTNGIVNTRFPNNRIFYVSSIIIQPDQKIILIGGTNIDPIRLRIALARYNQNGTLDESFGNKGRVTLNLHDTERLDFINCIAFQKDGKIVVAGSYRGEHPVTIFRLNTNGELDTSFGNAGIYQTPLTDFGNQSAPYKQLLIQSDGKILTGGSRNYNGTISGSIFRLNTDGTPDTTFGTNGLLRVDPNPRYFSINSIALQSDGKIIAVGNILKRLGVPYRPPSVVYYNYEVVIFRYNQNGTLDSSYADDGVSTFLTRKYNEHVQSSIIQSNDQILICGYVTTAFPSIGYSNSLIMRFNSSGLLDSSWGINGIVSTDFDSEESGQNNSQDIAIQPDNKIVTAGRNFRPNFVIARYLNQ